MAHFAIASARRGSVTISLRHNTRAIESGAGRQDQIGVIEFAAGANFQHAEMTASLAVVAHAPSHRPAINFEMDHTT